MKIYLTKFKDLILIKSKNFKDKRGFLREIFLEKLIKKRFKIFLISSSKKNVFRGLHFQLKKPQGKVVSVVKAPEKVTFKSPSASSTSLIVITPAVTPLSRTADAIVTFKVAVSLACV